MGLGNKRNEKCICGSGKKYKNCCGNYLEETRNIGKKIIFFVGNGLTINYVNEYNIKLCPSKPLDHFNSKSIDYEEVFDHYDELKYFFYNNKDKYDEFEAIKNFYKRYKNDKESINKFERFIIYAYSKFQIELEKYNYLRNFKIGKFLSINKNIIDSFISLNYDLLLERMLEENSVICARSYTDEEKKGNGGVLIHKPHGSIDFDFPTSAIKIVNKEAKWNSTIHGNIASINGVSQEVISKEDWLIPRTQPDVVSPSQVNEMFSIPWVKKIYERLKNNKKSIRSIVNFGFGYREEDRDEYNFLMDLYENITILDLNIEKNYELEKEAERRGHKYSFINICQDLPWEILEYI